MNEYKQGDSLKTFSNGPKVKKDGIEYKWGTIIPLIGGMSLGNSIFTQNKPQFLLSYSDFQANEEHLKSYWNDVPYFLINDADEEKRPDFNNHIFKKIDFVSAVPPCAGLSQLNSSMKKDSSYARGSEAKQNDWMYLTANLVLENIKPKVFWGENAPGLFTGTGEGVVKKLKEIAEKFNYSFSLLKTNSLYHGLPQKRERTFFFFWDSKNVPILENHYSKFPNYQEFLKQIPKKTTLHNPKEKVKVSTSSKLYEFILKHKNLSHKEFQKKYVIGSIVGILLKEKLLDEALSYLVTNYPENKEIKFIEHVKNKLLQGKGWWDSTPHVFYNKVNALVGRNLYQSMHPTEERFLTTREIMHLMGLPFNFEMVPNQQGKILINQIAQNVPTNAARDMTEEVCKFINNELPFHTSNFLKQKTKETIEVKKATKLF